MTEKIDTQGMSGPSTPGCTDNIYPHDENGDPILPKGVFKELPIFTDKERAELKEIMLEALREWVKETEYLTQPTDPEGRYYCSKSDCEGVRFTE
tara:strand:- start:930 stop:1214 length:285 start_codon:yes stop_codon:yes gene_type:complete